MKEGCLASSAVCETKTPLNDQLSQNGKGEWDQKGKVLRQKGEEKRRGLQKLFSSVEGDSDRHTPIS